MSVCSSNVLPFGYPWKLIVRYVHTSCNGSVSATFVQMGPVLATDSVAPASTRSSYSGHPLVVLFQHLITQQFWPMGLVIALQSLDICPCEVRTRTGHRCMRCRYVVCYCIAYFYTAHMLCRSFAHRNLPCH